MNQQPWTGGGKALHQGSTPPAQPTPHQQLKLLHLLQPHHHQPTSPSPSTPPTPVSRLPELATEPAMITPSGLAEPAWLWDSHFHEARNRKGSESGLRWTGVKLSTRVQRRATPPNLRLSLIKVGFCSGMFGLRRARFGFADIATAKLEA